MGNEKWLQNLATGDVVIVDNHDYRGTRTIAKVRRVTKTQIVLESGSKFRKVNGRPVGNGDWSCPFICEPTPDRLDEIAHNNLVRYLKNIVWKDLPLGVLKDTKALVHPHIKKGT